MVVSGQNFLLGRDNRRGNKIFETVWGYGELYTKTDYMAGEYV